MGKGGSASVAEKRSYLAETIPQPYEAITKKTLRDCIPAEYFVRSYTHSLGALCWDLVMAGMAYAAVHWCNDNLPAYAVPVAWLAYWWVQGLIFTGLWVIGHECGHGGFTDSRVVNDTVGFVVHSALLS
jgi:omega-6 fatty acid desaturase (delta-12 desaturase)